MSHMVLKRRRQGASLHYCDSGCQKHRMAGGRREATHTMLICGRVVYLCRGCATEMGAAYESAVGAA